MQDIMPGGGFELKFNFYVKMTSAEREKLADILTKKFIFRQNCGFNSEEFDIAAECNVGLELDEELKHNTISLDLGKLIQHGRQAQGLSQKELAAKINVKRQIINDYEAGRGIPNYKVLVKIERVLRLRLFGPNIGKSY